MTRIMAIFPVRNESDIVEFTVGKLLAQGVEVRLLDNWSDDGTWEIMKAVENPLLTLERWPKDGPGQYFNLVDLLRYIEGIANANPGSWQIHQGSDEILVPPWPGVSLQEAFARVRAEGANFIEVALHNFEPTADGFSRGMDPEQFFDRFWIERGHLHRRIWLQPATGVKIADSAGHNIGIEGRVIHPKKWIMKHYRLRSRSQGDRKMTDRRARYHPDEKKRGWHIHYNHIREGYDFVKNPDGLLSFRETYPELS